MMDGASEKLMSKMGEDRDFDLLEQEEESLGRSFFVSNRSSSFPRWAWVFAVVTFCSVSLNVAYYRQLIGAGCPKNCEAERYTPYAHLERNVPKPFPMEQREMAEEEWARYDADVGQIIISDPDSAKLGLPNTQRWPWDFDYGMYYLQGYHNLHCIYTIRRSLLEYRRGVFQSEHPTHVDHCLIELRDDTLCNADDTPRYTGGEFGEESGMLKQERMCRDWSKMVSWATSRSACYQSPSDPYDGKSELERYKFCPDGSTPWIGAEIWTMKDSQSKGRIQVGTED